MSETYSGPLVIITADEIDDLAELLHCNPREWNHDLRKRIKQAQIQKAIEEAEEKGDNG